MSVFLDQASDYITTASSIGSSAGNWTVAVWHRRTVTDVDYPVVYAQHSGGSNASFRNGSGSAMEWWLGAKQTPENAFTHAIGDWAYYVIQMSSDNWVIKAFGAGDTTPTVMESGVYSSGSPTLNFIRLGDNSGYSARGQFRYLRAWDAVLNNTELLAEKTNATVQRGTNLLGSWSLDNNTDTTADSGSAGSLTFSGSVTTSTEEPTLGGGASAVVKRLMTMGIGS